MTREEAQAVRLRRRARMVRIRKTVAALSLTLFIAMFSTIYVQMAAGRDPVLSAQAATKSAQTTTSSDDTSTSGSSATDTGTTTDQPASVTTSQS